MSSGTIGLLIGGQSEKLTASGSLADTVDKCVFNKPVANQLMTETHTFHVLSLPKNPSQVARLSPGRREQACMRWTDPLHPNGARIEQNANPDTPLS
jgi:hypothetical protein